MGAEKQDFLPSKKQIIEHRKIWNELILNMAEGDVQKANEIKRMDATLEFWQYFDYWRQKQKEKLDQIKQQQQKRK